MNYHLTQALTGHGSFRAYKSRIGKSDGGLCQFCGDEDTPGHTLFQCRHWNPQREATEKTVGAQLCEANLVEIMLESQEYWSAVDGMVRAILSTKEAHERVGG